MSQEPVTTFSYNAKHYQTLMTEYKGLLTFADVTAWDQRASAEVEKIDGAIREAVESIADVSRKLELAKKEHAEKNFIARWFSSRSVEKSLYASIQNYTVYKAGLEGFALQLQEAIDFTPNSAEDKTSLLKELKARKKELQLEKREAAAAMKAIRTDARKQSSTAGNIESRIFGTVYNSQSAAYERRSIRYQKESALRPHEDAKTSIERQLIQVDRDIFWAERFTS